MITIETLLLLLYLLLLIIIVSIVIIWNYIQVSMYVDLYSLYNRGKVTFVEIETLQ